MTAFACVFFFFECIVKYTLTAAAKNREFRLNALIETGMINTHFPDEPTRLFS